MNYRSDIAAVDDERGRRARATALLRAGRAFTMTAGRWISESMNDDATGVRGFAGSLVATAMWAGAFLSLRLLAPGVWNLFDHLSAGSDELFGIEVLIVLIGLVAIVGAAVRILAAGGRRLVSLACRLKGVTPLRPRSWSQEGVPLAHVSSEDSVQRAGDDEDSQPTAPAGAVAPARRLDTETAVTLRRWA